MYGATFESLHGVSSVVSGYSGGSIPNPTYAQVTTGETGHMEVVEVTYDPRIIDYQALLNTFHRSIQPMLADNLLTVVHHTNGDFHALRGAEALALESKKRLTASQIFDAQSLPKSCLPQLFTRPRNIIRSTTKPMPLQYKFYRYRSGRINF